MRVAGSTRGAESGNTSEKEGTAAKRTRAYRRFVFSVVLVFGWMCCIFLRTDVIFAGPLYYINFGIAFALFAVMIRCLGHYLDTHDEQDRDV